jgi:hypothetical protein
MGEVRTEITLANLREKTIANRGYMPQEQVRRLTVNAVVDTRHVRPLPLLSPASLTRPIIGVIII